LDSGPLRIGSLPRIESRTREVQPPTAARRELLQVLGREELPLEAIPAMEALVRKLHDQTIAAHSPSFPNGRSAFLHLTLALVCFEEAAVV
jgi:hypothetical protein